VFVPALVRLWHILAIGAFFGLIAVPLLNLLGLKFGLVALVTLVFALAGVLRNASASAFADVDKLLLKVPVVSTIYEDWFRADTYYRQDARIVYLQRLPALIKEMAEEITASKGAKLVQQYEHAPVLGELYKPIQATKEPTPA
jgi:hypothetical protein